MVKMLNKENREKRRVLILERLRQKKQFYLLLKNLIVVHQLFLC